MGVIMYLPHYGSASNGPYPVRVIIGDLRYKLGEQLVNDRCSGTEGEVKMTCRRRHTQAVMNTISQSAAGVEGERADTGPH